MHYTVLEANAKVSGIGEISHPYPSKFGYHFKYITMSTQGVSVQNLIKIDSAVAALRMLDKNEFGVGFC